MIRTLAVALVLLPGCYAFGPRGYSDPEVPGITIITAAEAARLGYRGEPLEVVGAGDDGTALVLAFLEEAKKSGAVAVSELEVDVATTIDGRPARCTTLVGPKEEVEQRARVVSRPGRYERRMVMKPVSRYVTEQQYRCRPVQKMVTRYETTYDRSYDYYSKSYRTTPRTRPVQRFETKNECRYEPVSRHVTRYEYQWESNWIPPEWSVISERYSRWTLVESEPDCGPADAPDLHEAVEAGPLEPEAVPGDDARRDDRAGGSVRGMIHLAK